MVLGGLVEREFYRNTMNKTDSLNHTKMLIDKLNIVNFVDTNAPLSESDVQLLHLQLTAAQILLSDAKVVQQEQPQRTLPEIIEELSQTWKDNIHDFALALSEDK